MLKPLEQFYCDTCEEIIDAPDQGMVEWLQSTTEPAHSFEIVHHVPHSPRVDSGVSRSQNPRPQGCYQHQNKPLKKDLKIERYIGRIGLVQLLQFIDVGPHHVPNYSGVNFDDGREFAELFRRLQLPYYEEARRYWDQAKRDGFFDGANENRIYQSDFLEGIVSKYG